MRVDVKGMSGKRVGFFTVLWKSILAYSVETAGAFFDRDMELKLHTNIRTVGTIEQDLRHGKCDLFQLQKVLCNHILGEDTKPMEGLDTHAGEVDQKVRPMTVFLSCGLLTNSPNLRNSAPYYSRRAFGGSETTSVPCKLFIGRSMYFARCTVSLNLLGFPCLFSDTVEMNNVYHSNPRILRGNEVIEMAFKGHRDMTIL
jgi:Bacterial PH domain